MDQQPPEIQSNRLPFDVELYKRADEFCTAAMTAVPELHGIAIVPLWSTQPKNTPAGILRLRNPQPPYLASLLMLLKRLAAFSAQVHNDLFAQFEMIDRYAAELSSQIKAKVEELATLNRQQDGQNDN
jgi:hypothetical protein